MWFTWKQNNSGGRFTGPAICVSVEADSAEKALKLAKEAGVDEGAPYCSCCGERWSESYYSEDERKLPPFGASWEDSLLGRASGLYRERGVPQALYIHADGTREEVTL